MPFSAQRAQEIGEAERDSDGIEPFEYQRRLEELSDAAQRVRDEARTFLRLACTHDAADKRASFPAAQFIRDHLAVLDDFLSGALSSDYQEAAL